MFVVPHPRFRIDRFADGAQQTQRGEIVLLRPLVAPFHERADRRRRGVKNGDAILRNDAPKAIRLRPVRRPFVHQGRRAIGQRAVDDVAVAGDPADVGRAPKDVFLAKIEDVLGRDGDAKQIAAGSVKNALRFAGRSAGVKDEKRMFAVERLGRTIGAHIFDFAVPPNVAALANVNVGFLRRKTITRLTASLPSSASSTFFFSGTIWPRR